MAGSAARARRCAPRRFARPHAEGDRRVAVQLDANAERHRRLSQGGSHARRRRHARAFVRDDDERTRRRALFHRRGSGCHGLARRLQLSVGMGVGRRGGQGRGRVRAERVDGRLSVPGRGFWRVSKREPVCYTQTVIGGFSPLWQALKRLARQGSLHRFAAPQNGPLKVPLEEVFPSGFLLSRDSRAPAGIHTFAIAPGER
ncbi:protein of unknown function (plasmid) [Caballeronia sp. S22]